MQLVIVESPAKAKTINKYLGSDYKVIASFGHIRDLPSKNGSVEPDNDFAMHYEISSQSTKHVKTIADEAQKAETIFLATDPDREGEAISWHIIEALKAKRKLKKNVAVHRIVFHEITKKAVQEAIKKPRAIDMDLVNAQQARRALDYLVGFTLSPVLWHKLPGSRSAGRVQSVALRLVCERENEIEKFNSKEYWNILLHLLSPKNEPFTAKLTHFNGKKLEQFDLNNESDTKAALAKVSAHSYHVAEVEKKQSRRNPQPPFTTSSLQQEASRKLGFGAKQTMMVAQKLYEGVDIGGETTGLITYMRTDSVTVAQEALAQTRTLIGQQYGDAYLPDAPRTYQSKAKNAQEAHEAIRPTDVTRLPKQMQAYLSDEQAKLYKLVWDRMVASQMESAILDQVAVNIISDNKQHTARATGSTVKFDGFYHIYREGSDDESSAEGDQRILPVLAQGDAVSLKDAEPTQHFTQPPPRYTEASLVKRLEELGIGRPSTYASIISVLQDRDYVKLDKKRFVAEDRGRIVTAFLESFFKRYVEYDFTAQLEEELDHISNGQIDWKTVLKQFWTDFNVNIQDAKKHTITEVITQLNQLLADFLFPKNAKGEINRICPLCTKGELSLKLGKFGAFLGCSDYPECNYTKPLSHGKDGQESDDNASGEHQDAKVFEPKPLGTDPETGKEMTLRQGPYGWYVQLGDAEKKMKPKRASIPKTMDPHALTFDEALSLLALPREVGIHPETGKPILAGFGRFGPYLQHNNAYTSLKEDNVLTIGINRAVVLIAEAPTKGKRAAATPLRIIGQYPKTKHDIAVYTGRYGPYIKYQKTNINIPKGTNYETLSLDEAVALIDKKLEK